MHSRNPYRNALDFEALVRAYPPLSKFVQGRNFDFQDDSGQRCLTQALLKRDFNLELDLPADRLCPPVPNRLNYVLWIQDIVSQMQQFVPAVCKDNVEVQGLDIGTGASAIYPLLACTLEQKWSFVATELDEQSYTHASKNVKSNGLSGRIRVVKVSEQTSTCGGEKFGFDHLFSLLRNHTCENDNDASTQTNSEQRIQFTMCNPPFYSSAAEVRQSEALKEHDPFGVCTGAPIEMITPGGETSFVEAMVRESVSARSERHTSPGMLGIVEKRQRTTKDASTKHQVDGLLESTEGSVIIEESKMIIPQREGPRWYTSMLGKMGSVAEVVSIFKALGISNYALTEFVQGQTRRWAVGWSLDAWRLHDDIARIANPNPTLQRLLPPRNVLRFPISAEEKDFPEKLFVALREMEVTISESTPDRADGTEAQPFIVYASCDTWSRNARRKRKRKETSDGAIAFTPLDVTGNPELVCAVASKTQNKEKVLEIQWIYGRDRGLLESFASHIANKMTEK